MCIKRDICFLLLLQYSSQLMSALCLAVRKLKDECCKLGAKLEELSHHSRDLQVVMPSTLLDECVKLQCGIRCCRLFAPLESRPALAVKVLLDGLSQAKRGSELEHLTLEKQHLEDTVKRLRARLSEMEEQCVQHGRMHQRMKDRCANLCIGFH
ncbi:hypothetical protein XENOCAPTIV_027640 [Xenoophorus captivus]|uniref:Uncharacterized protein n=1 Tax=Xenoophorus captivus TaxID=1517983 RepID=A0ABV0RT67_9TELE